MVARFWGGARGWNTDQFGRHRLPLLVRLGVSSEAWGVERGDRGRSGSWERCWVLGERGAGSSLQGRPVPRTPIAPRGGWVRRGGGVGVWSYVENCTVDAS